MKKFIISEEEKNRILGIHSDNKDTVGKQEKCYSELSVRLLSHNIAVQMDPHYDYSKLEEILDNQFKTNKHH